MTDHYEVLGIPRDAEREAVRLAYRRAARRHHPDAGGTDEAMREVNAAYEVLGDPAARAAYDATLPRKGVRTIRVRMKATMPWGRHAGEELTEVPAKYLRWVLEKADYATPELRKQIKDELDRRRSAPGRVEYVRRGATVHVSLDGDLPPCGSFWGWRGNERRTTYWPGGNACRKGCFES